MYFGAVIPYVEEKQAVVVLLSVPETPCGSRERMQIPASTVPELHRNWAEMMFLLLGKGNSYSHIFTLAQLYT